MDQREEKEQIDSTQNWEKFYRHARNAVWDVAFTLEHSEKTAVPSAEHMCYAYHTLAILLDILNNQHKKQTEIESQISKITKVLETLEKKVADYEPHLAYVKKFAEDQIIR